MKYEKCVVGVSNFMMCFTKSFAKYPQNVKYDECIASLRTLFYAEKWIPSSLVLFSILYNSIRRMAFSFIDVQTTTKMTVVSDVI